MNLVNGATAGMVRTNLTVKARKVNDKISVEIVNSRNELTK